MNKKLIKEFKIVRHLKIAFSMDQAIKRIEDTVNKIYMPQVERIKWQKIQGFFKEYLEDVPSNEDWEDFKNLWFATTFAYRALEHLKQNEEFLFDENLRREFLNSSKLNFYKSMLKHGMGYKSNKVFKALQKLNEIIPKIFKQQEFQDLMFKISQIYTMEKEIEEFLSKEAKGNE